MTKQLLIRLDPALHERLRTLSFHSQVSMNALATAGIEAVLEAEEGPKANPSEMRGLNGKGQERTRGSRLPADWAASVAEQRFAADLDLDPAAVEAEFRDYWHARAGAQGVKLDWPATWRNWCRRAAEFRRKIAVGDRRSESLRALTQAGIARSGPGITLPDAARRIADSQRALAEAAIKRGARK